MRACAQSVMLLLRLRAAAAFAARRRRLFFSPFSAFARHIHAARRHDSPDYAVMRHHHF